MESPSSPSSSAAVCALCWLDAADSGDLPRMQAILSQIAQGAKEVQNSAESSERACLLNAQDELGRTALFLSCMRNHEASVRWLLQQGARVEVQDQFADSALLKAIVSGSLPCVQLLLAHGACTSLLDSEGTSGVLWACTFDDVAMVRFLWGQRHRLNFDARNAHGCTPLMVACENGSIDCARFLLQEARVGLEEEDASGKTALIHACVHGNMECVRLLLSQGAAVEHTDHDGDTPLIWAAWQGHCECVEHMVLRADAAIDHQDAAGYTALMQAVRWGHTACVRLLLDLGANATLASHQGSNAWSMAVCADSPSEEVIAWISEAVAKQHHVPEAAPADRVSVPEVSSSASAFTSSLAAFSPPPPRLSLAQSCFQDGLQLIFAFLPLRDAVALLSAVCTQWRSAWERGVTRTRPPLHFLPRSAAHVRQMLRSPVAAHLRVLHTYDSAGASAAAAASASSSVLAPHQPAHEWSLTVGDVALLAARAPALTHLVAQLRLPEGGMLPSDDEGEDLEEDEEPLAPDAAAAAFSHVDEYESSDEHSFRFPFALQSLILHLEETADEGDGDEEANSNLTRLLVHIARLPFLHSLELGMSPADAAEVECLSLLRNAPALRSLALYATNPRDHLVFTPSTLASLAQLAQLESLSLNRGEGDHLVLAVRDVQLPLLRSYDMDRTAMDARLMALLLRLPSLTRVSPSTWSSTRALASLSSFPHLRTLHVRLRAEVRPQCVPVADLAPLALLPALTCLALSQIDLAHSADAAAAWAGGMRAMQLRSLQLSHMRLPSTTLAVLAECTPLLEELAIQRCSTQPSSEPVSLELLAGLVHLRSLRVAFSLCDANAAVVALLRFPCRMLPSLRTLHWSPCVDSALHYDHSGSSDSTPVVERWSTL